MGKSYAEQQREYEDAKSKAAGREAVHAALREHFCITDDEDLADDRTLGSFDADSLDVVELSILIEERLGVELDDDELIAAATVGEVIAIVDRAVRGDPKQ